MQHGLEGSKKQKKTPRYIGHRGVLTHKVLKSLDSPVHRTPGSLNSPVHRTPGVSTPRYIGHRGVSTPWYIGHRGVILKCLELSQ